MNAQACVLVSGGIESSVLLADALQRCSRVQPVYVRNHLRWEKTELFWLKKYLTSLPSRKLLPLKILEIPMREVYHKHWSTTGKSVPGADSPDEAVYLPGRNLILLSQAAVLAVVSGIPAIEIGVLKGNPFSDSTPAFFRAVSKAVTLGLGRRIEIRAPFRKLIKPQVILKGRMLALHLTFSCIDPRAGKHCGRCNKCVERKTAFFNAGIKDKTEYTVKGMPA